MAKTKRPLAVVFLGYWFLHVAAGIAALTFGAASLIQVGAHIASGFLLAFFAPHIKRYVLVTALLESAIWTLVMFTRRDATTLFSFGLDSFMFMGLLVAYLFKFFVLGMTMITVTASEVLLAGFAFVYLMWFTGVLLCYGVDFFLIWLMRLRKRSAIRLNQRMFLS